MSYPKKEKTLTILHQLDKFQELLGLQELNTSLLDLRKSIEGGQFRVVVVGEVKKGKSSLINALLDNKELLPEFKEIATSVAFKIIYGEEAKNTVFFKKKYSEAIDDDSDLVDLENYEELSAITISDSDLEDYGTEKGNPGNEKNVEHILIELPNEILKTGIEIIDTPGLGGMFQYHAEISWKYLPTADAVLLVLDSTDSPLTREEKKWIHKIKNFNSVFLFTQTKIDTVSALQWQSWQARNLKILTKLLEKDEKDIFYFPISSVYKIANPAPNSKMYQRSGFKALQDFFFEQLQKEIVGSKCARVVELMQQSISVRLQQLNEHERVVGETSIEKLKELQKAYKAAIVKMKELELQIFPDLKDEFMDELRLIEHEGVQEISNLLQSHRLNPEISIYIQKIQESNQGAKAINKDIDKLVGAFTDDISEKALDFYQQNIRKTKNLVNQYTITLNGQLESIRIRDPKFDSELVVAVPSLSRERQLEQKLPIGRADKIRFDQWDATKNMFFSTSVGSSLGYTAGAIISVFFPPVAPYLAVVALSGSGAGLLFSNVSTNQKRKKQVLNHLQSLLLGIVNQLQRKFISQYRSDISSVRTQVSKEFRRLIREAREFNEQHLKLIKTQINKRGKIDQEEVKVIKHKIRTATNMLNYLKNIENG